MSVTVERRDAVAWVRVHDAPQHLLRATDVGLLRQELVALDADPRVRVIVLAGLPGAFPRQLHPDDALAMADAAPPWVPATLVDAATASLHNVSALQRVLDQVPAAHRAFIDQLLCARVLEGSDTLSVAALTGPVYGGGMELALCCDLRWCSDASDTWLAQPEVLAGVMPGFGATQRLPRLVGKAHALELMLMCEAVSPGQALSMGLVSRVLEADAFEATVQGLAERLARRPVQAATSTHRAVARGLDGSLAAGLRVELQEVQRVWSTAGAREGLAKVAKAAAEASLDQPLPELLSQFES